MRTYLGMPLAPRLQNLGVHSFPVSTKVERAQLFMNQGLNLAYAFNHAEARRAFRPDPDDAARPGRFIRRRQDGDQFARREERPAAGDGRNLLGGPSGR